MADSNECCGQCGMPAKMFCLTCDTMLCAGSCCETHRSKIPNSFHDLEEILNRRLFKELGVRGFEERRYKYRLANDFLTRLALKADQSLADYKQELESAFVLNLQMMEEVHSRYAGLLQLVRQDLPRVLVQNQFEFDCLLTESVYHYHGAVDENLPDLFEEMESTSHVKAVISATKAAGEYFRETDLDLIQVKFMNLIRKTAMENREAAMVRAGQANFDMPEHPLIPILNRFITEVYLRQHSKPNSELALEPRLPYRLRHTLRSLPHTPSPISTPRGLYIGQISEKGVSSGFGALIVVHDGSRSFPFHNGDLYVGEWEEGVITGRGMMVFADGTLYEGTWENEEPLGSGSFNYLDDSRYDGEILRGQYHGRGKFIYSDGSFYDGNWRKGQREGWGVFANVRVKCEGEWSSDTLHVEGLQAGYYPNRPIH